MQRTRCLAGVVLVGAALVGAPASRAATVPPACAPVSAAAPSLRTLAEGVRLDLGPADQIASVRVAAPPRYFWGKTLGPRKYPITPRSPWIYVRVRPLDPADRASNVTRQRAIWQAALLVQSLHAAVCTAGSEPEAGDSGETPHGARAFDLGSGAVTRLSLLRDWPYARVGSAFRARLHSLARRYDFRVTSLVVLHADGDAPQIRIQSDHPNQLIPQLRAIVQELAGSRTANCWASDACINGLWIEADDASGRPFLMTSSVLAGPADDGGYGGQWVRSGLPYPYSHR